VQEEEAALIMRRFGPLTLFVSLASTLALLPAAASAETHTFLDTTDLFPTGGALTEGPANEYPSSIVVSGVPGTVTKATVTVLDLGSSSPDDIDMVMTGPNGQAVLVMSDVCGENPKTLTNEDWTFDDAAPTFLSDGGPCAPNQTASFKPSNNLGPLDDDLSAPPLGASNAPAPPYLNKLSFLAGGSPNGSWNLFVRDDNAVGFNGFGISAWELTLDVKSPAAAPVTPPPATLTSTPQPSGQAQAPKKCKRKKTKKPSAAAAGKKCKKKK
jgi:hypothetical protein